MAAIKDQILNHLSLTKEEEKELFIKRDKGDKSAEDAILMHNCRLVECCCYNYDYGEYRDDLFSAGFIGLIEAIKRFDYTKDCKFATYALWWVRGNILEFLRHKGIITVPKIICGIATSKIWQIVKRLRQEDCTDKISIEDIASALEGYGYHDREKIIEAVSILLNIGQTNIEDMNIADNDSDELTIERVLGNGERINPDDINRFIAKEWLKQTTDVYRKIIVMFHIEHSTYTDIATVLKVSVEEVEKMLISARSDCMSYIKTGVPLSELFDKAGLSEVEREVIEKHDLNEKSLIDIAEERNCTRECIRQIHHRAIKKLRKIILIFKKTGG